ncbi:MAG TPA: PKD domain-containing protein, partial [Pseudonocardiaceae bacterium]|nr:PKD domain-containing protein [Pseudonocardiaceae bacterium]
MSRGVIPLLIAGALVAGSATVATAATTPTDLFVGGAGCSNTGPGSQSTPFCTIQAAAAVVLPGQTVHVATGEYNGPITITRSGEQGAPITFVKADGATNVLILPHGGVGFSVTAAHDVAISGFQVIDGAPAVAVSDSSRITVEHNLLTGDPTSTGGGVVVSGTSSDVTVSRNDVFGNRGDGVSVQSGVTGTTVITNAITDNTGTAVAVDDAPGTVITSNTAFFNCGTGIALTGASTGATIENNILDDDSTAAGPAFCGTVPAQSELTVAADATTGTTADYDIVFNSVNDFVYDWAGVARTSAATFTAATGQGAHDINANPRVTSNTGQVATTSPAIDSADSAAPGEQTVDELGNPRVDDPLVPNTGIGVADRGAVEVSDPFQVGGVTMSPTKAPVGASVTATVDVTDPWSTALSFSFDFGDGTAPVVTSAPSATHTYTSVGTHTVTVTGSTPAGVRQVRTTTVQTAPVAPLVANVRAYQTELLGVAVNTNASTDSWQITDSAIDFGDGTAVQHTAIGEASHTYAAPGRYTVTSTVTDFAGNTDVATQQVTVAGGYSALGPVRVLDTRDGTGGVRVAKLGAGGVVSLKLAGTHGIPATGVRAVVLNVTAVSPTAASFLTVYPDGTTRPV